MKFTYINNQCNLHCIVNYTLQFFRIGNCLYQIPKKLIKQKVNNNWFYTVWCCTEGCFQQLKQDTKVIPVSITIDDSGPYIPEVIEE